MSKKPLIVLPLIIAVAAAGYWWTRHQRGAGPRVCTDPLRQRGRPRGQPRLRHHRAHRRAPGPGGRPGRGRTGAGPPAHRQAGGGRGRGRGPEPTPWSRPWPRSRRATGHRRSAVRGPRRMHSRPRHARPRSPSSGSRSSASRSSPRRRTWIRPAPRRTRPRRRPRRPSRPMPWRSPARGPRRSPRPGRSWRPNGRTWRWPGRSSPTPPWSSPAPGIVRERILQPGDMASPQTPGAHPGPDEPALGARLCSRAGPGPRRPRGAVPRCAPTASRTRSTGAGSDSSPPPPSSPPRPSRPRTCAPVSSTRCGSSSATREDELRLGMPATVTIPLDQPPAARQRPPAERTPAALDPGTRATAQPTHGRHGSRWPRPGAGGRQQGLPPRRAHHPGPRRSQPVGPAAARSPG